MIRSLTRNMICFCAAIVLLMLMVCAVEVVLRGLRFRSELRSHPQVSVLEELITPDEATWIDVRPLMDQKWSFDNAPEVRIRTNEQGLRNASISIPKPRGVYRILCLGGDNVFGSRQDVKESLPVKLQQALARHSGMPVEVLNAGCPHAGPLINLLRYRSHLSTLQADLIIFCLNEEDLHYDRDVRGALHLDPNKNPAYASHPGLRGRGSPFMDGLCAEFVTADWLLGWAGDIAGMRSASSKTNTVPLRDSIHRDLAAIVPLSELVSGNFAHLLISISPSAWGVDRARNSLDKSQSSFAEDVRHFLKDVRLSQQVEVHDGLAAFIRPGEVASYLSAETGDLSSQGNELYAQQLATFLLQTIPGLNGTPATSRVPPPGAASVVR